MKKMISTLILGTSLVALTACSLTEEKIVTTSSGHITKDEFYDKLVDNYGPAVLESMIQEKVLRENYSVSDKELKEQLETYKSQFSTDDEFKELLDYYNLTEKDIENQIEVSLLEQKATIDGIKVTDKELQKYYKENADKFSTATASHILVEDEKTAKELKKQLDDGADFAELAKEHSTDTASVATGGSLGQFSKGDMVKEFSDAAFSIALNTVSEPIKSEYGYHLILVTERTEKTIEKNKDEIKKQYLLENAKESTKVIEELKEKEKVEIKDDELKDKIEKLLSSSPEEQ